MVHWKRANVGMGGVKFVKLTRYAHWAMFDMYNFVPQSIKVFSKIFLESVFLDSIWNILIFHPLSMSNMLNWLDVNIEQFVKLTRCVMFDVILSPQNIKVFRKIFLNRYFWIPSEIFQHFTHCQCQTCEIDSMQCASWAMFDISSARIEH